MSAPSGIFIFAVISIASTVPFAPTEFTSLKACEKLDDFNGIYELDSHGFVQTVKACNDEFRDHTSTPSNGTEALLEVYNAIKGVECIFTDKIEKKLMACVNKIIGFQPPFTTAGAKQHFGPNNETVAFQFKDQECQYSAQVRECVELTFSENKTSTELLGCKQSIMRGFNITAGICREDVVRGDRGSGIRYLPSDLLILGSAVMLLKVTIFS